MVLHAHALYQPAVLAYERAIRLEPNEFRWHYYLAIAVQQLSGPEKALVPLNDALRIRPDYAPALLKKGDLLFQLGRFAESERSYKEVLDADPGSPEALYDMGRVKSAQNDIGGAQDFYGRACRAFPSYGAAYFGLATIERGLGQAADSEKHFNLAQRFANQHPITPDPLATEMGAMATGIYYHLGQGDRLAQKGQMDEAARLNENLLERDSKNLTALLNLLYLSRFVDRLSDKVDAFYARAVEINPQVPVIYGYYGAALAHQGKYDAAAAAVRKAIELRPDYGEAHDILGEILERQNSPAEAIEQYQRALASQSSDAKIQMKLWRLLILQGRGREAIQQILPTLQVNDSYSALRLVVLGEAFLTTGEMAEARKYLEQARGRARSDGPADLAAQIDQELAQIARR